jgi:hypothetical protein
LTPQARVIELPAGSTPVDFAYHVHSGLGHRCRGARVDGHLVPLNTVLRNGQTIEVVVARAGSAQDGPSRDWLNPQLGFVRSQRARAKVRQWFNALEHARDLANGREKVERLLQREGRTALSLDELARRLKLASTDELFLAVNREEIGPRMLEEAVREYIELFCGDTQPQELQALRELALVWMDRLQEFRPHLAGAVWRGTATRLSDIYLQRGRYREALDALRGAGKRMAGVPGATQLMADQSKAQASSRASRMAVLKSAMGRVSSNNLPLT